MELTPGKLWGLRRLADADGRFKMLAVDQRPPIKQLVAAARGTAESAYDDVAAVKLALIEELASEASAVLADPHYAYPMAAPGALPPAKGLILTLEDSIFVETKHGRLSRPIDSWSVAKIKRAGGDAVKVLAWYRPDAAPSICDHQKAFVARIGDACRVSDIPFVFELLVYPFPGDQGHTTDYVEQPAKRADHVIASVEAFAGVEFGVDLFKLESPLPASDIVAGEDAATQELFDRLGAAANRPWVMLSAGANAPQFRRVLEYAYRAGASGYLAGRAIWADAAKAFPDMDALRSSLADGGVGFMREINHLTDRAATPWHAHESYGEGGPRLAAAGPDFRHRYGAS